MPLKPKVHCSSASQCKQSLESTKKKRKIGNPLHQLHKITEHGLISLLQTCKTSNHLHQIHAQVVTNGFQYNQQIIPKILTLSFDLLGPQHSQLFFNLVASDQQQERPNTVFWNVMFKGYTKSGFHVDTLEQFDEMRRRGVRPNRYTFTFVLKSCARIKGLRKGEEVHCFAVRSGFWSNHFVGTALIDVYSGCGVLSSARRVFDEMSVKNVVTWAAILAAYVSSNDLDSAREIFNQVEDRDLIIWNMMISGYLKEGKIKMARELFDLMQDKDLMCWNTMLHGYAHGANIKACERFFAEMPERNVFSWNSLIAGYVTHDQFARALRAFNWMLRESGDLPNEATIVMVLSASSKIGTLDIGKWIHVYAYGIGLRGSVNIANGLIDMYSKCGNIDTAIEVFDSIAVKDVISWNVMIGGLAAHGHGIKVLRLFSKMRNAGQVPDGITFIAVLCACSHMGLVQEGFAYFRSMVQDYNITPWIEHYGCIVDLLGRAGLLDEALKFVQAMPMEADHIIWSSLLAACQTKGDINLAEISMKQLVELQPEDAANYVALSNTYGFAGRWKDVAKAKHLMRENSAGKLPGCSSIEVNQEVAEFYSMDVNHSQAGDIYRTLESLTEVSKVDLSSRDFFAFDELIRNLTT